MSANAFGSDWANLEGGTFRFRDPLNNKRRFIPLRLDASPIKGSLTQFLYIDWLSKEREHTYKTLLEACHPPAGGMLVFEDELSPIAVEANDVISAEFSSDRTRVLTGHGDGTLKIWDVMSGSCIRTFKGKRKALWHLAWSANQRRALSCDADGNVLLWNLETGRFKVAIEGNRSDLDSAAWSGDQRRMVSGGLDNTLRLWSVKTGKCLRLFDRVDGKGIACVAVSHNRHQVLAGGRDNTIGLWDIDTGRCLRVFEGHTGELRTVVWSLDELRFLSGGKDGTIRLWETETGRCLRVIKGHTDCVWSIAWSSSQTHALSGSHDRKVKLWELETGRCLHVFQGHKSKVRAVAWSVDQGLGLSADIDGGIRVWYLSEFLKENSPGAAPEPTAPLTEEQVQYTNAKVLLVGESGAGKTGLAKVLAGEQWQPSDSTVGAWATQWKIPVSSGDSVEREIWLWDFGGQADQRLIHQLYFDETALAVLIFDGQNEDVFEALGQWDRDLKRAANKGFSKLLAAGRVDAGGLRASRSQVEAFAKERGFPDFLETSAKFGTGCEQLKQAILNSIKWDDIPWRSSPLLFKRLKDEIIRLKDDGRVLMRFNELRETLLLRLSAQGVRFSDDKLKAVIGLLAGPGVVWELKFGSWVLLQPERINAYAQAVIQTMREDEYDRGCIAEERVLQGDLTYRSSVPRLETEEERFILLAMHQTLMERGLCLRQHTEDGPLLIFPSYYRRERPILGAHPAVLVTYCFNGFIDDIYASLVVRLHHTSPFRHDQLWRYAADFRTLTNKPLGIKVTRRSEGAGELEVYFDPVIPVEEKIIFSKYIHEHLLQNASDVVRLRHYVCPHCGTLVGNREVAMKRLQEGKKDILCVQCDDSKKRVPLWDEMEEMFASETVRQQVRDLQEESAIVLDTESKERVLVGEVVSTVALAGQICREFNVSDHGIDMEIEFKSDVGQATGQKVYLQLKSGDSYLTTRRKDDAEIFKIEKQRHAEYWRGQAFPVLLVIRNSDGKIRWMEVRDYLKRESENGSKAIKHIVFEGERFDVLSVRRWRDSALGKLCTARVAMTI